MFTIDEIARATGGTISGSGVTAVEGISTDSRTVAAGELFVPLRGANFDGHHFIAAARERGVRAVLAERSWTGGGAVDMVVISVADTLRALGDLAAFHRSRFSIPVVGVTGSNGKTTTKEMLASILSVTGKGLKTTGNLNNLIGLPHMLLRLTGQDRWAVLEMGMSEPGEIDRLAELAQPQVGIITNAFPAHLETMGSVEAVARAKGELFARLPSGGTAVFNADDPRIAAQPSPAGVTRLSFGLHQGEIRAARFTNRGMIGQEVVLQLPHGEVTVLLQAFGRHNVANACAAAAAAVALGIGHDTIREGLEAFTPYDKRFRLEEISGIILIDDSYNANPASMEAALGTLRELKGEKRAVAALGDMLELGTDAKEAHAALGRLAASCVDIVVTTGDMAEVVAAGAVDAGLARESVLVVKDHEELLQVLGDVLKKGDFLLAKGSRGMRMEKVAEAVREGRLLPRDEGDA